MTFKTCALTTAFCVAAGLAQANELSGSLGLQYNRIGDKNATQYTGSVEYSFSQNLGLAADLSGYNISDEPDNQQALTLHGIYHMNNLASFGLFFGQSQLGDTKRNSYGLEFGTELSGATLEGYVAQSSLEDSERQSIYLGGKAQYTLGNGYNILADIDYIDYASNKSTTHLAVGSSYDIANGPQLFAKIGALRDKEANGSKNNETFFAIGAEISFGNSRGSTFSARNIKGASFGF